MTLITVGLDEVLLLRQLRQRLAYVDRRIATEGAHSLSENPITYTRADSVLAELYDEREWLTGLIQSVQGVEHED